MQFLERFENTLGIIVAALILGFVAWILFNKWEKMQKDSSEAEVSGGSSLHLLRTACFMAVRILCHTSAV